MTPKDFEVYADIEYGVYLMCSICWGQEYPKDERLEALILLMYRHKCKETK